LESVFRSKEKEKKGKRGKINDFLCSYMGKAFLMKLPRPGGKGKKKGYDPLKGEEEKGGRGRTFWQGAAD